MRKLIVGAVLALALPGVVNAAPTQPTPADLAKAGCKTEKHEMGARLFKKTYAARSVAKAMNACVAKAVPVAESQVKNAAHACKAERDADRDAFAEKYGENGNKKNAYGKCVSATAQEGTEDAAEDRADAAQSCKALKREDPAAFEQAWGSKRNAFGKCVSATAKPDGA